MKYVSIDIGSTWTKGAVFDLSGSELACERRAVFPTSVDNLSDAYFRVLHELVGPGAIDRVRGGEIGLSYSSSAKGGLSVAALGIVPEVTLETAKVAAYSAGAKLTRVLSYRLTRSDIRALEESPPDIVLFAGGTDGGNTDYVLSNAHAIAKSRLACSVVYAGNRCVQDEVNEILAEKDLVVVDNVLPEMESPNPDPARQAMRNIFLSKIAKGKGLDIIVRDTGVEPLPTPYAVYEFAKSIRQHVPGWEEFILLDMGGATTDVYSAHREEPAAGTVIRGLPEPDVKRTVEGDLGMRVSAVTAADAARALMPQLRLDGDQASTLTRYAEQVARAPDSLPANSQEAALDEMLAGACVAHACARHAGRATMVYTPDGDVRVQTGRDLGKVPRVIGSGGWLSKRRDFDPGHWMAQMRIDARGKSVLLPGDVAYYRDEDYLFPLLANVARDLPEAAARAGVRTLTRST